MYDAKLDISIQETVKDFSNTNLNKNQIIDLMKHEQFSDYFISTDNSNLKLISKKDYSIDSSNIQSKDCSYNILLKQDQIIYHKCLDACERAIFCYVKDNETCEHQEDFCSFYKYCKTVWAVNFNWRK